MAQLLNKASMEHSCAKIFVTGRQGMGKVRHPFLYILFLYL
jgi:hypothetical protein